MNEYTRPSPTNSHPSIPDEGQVSEGAWIGPTVELGAGVTVGPGSVIGYGPKHNALGAVKIGEHAYVAPRVHIETDVVVGRGVRIESGSFIGSGSRLGDEVHIGPHCTIMGDCEIREYAVLSAEVFVCKSSVLETHCQLMPGAKLLDHPCPPLPLNTRGPTVGHCAVVGSNAIIWSGMRVGCHAIIAAGSIVKNDVPEYMLVQGSPAKPICGIRWIRTRVGDGWIFPYPWTRYFIEGEDMSRPARESS